MERFSVSSIPAGCRRTGGGGTRFSRCRFRMRLSRTNGMELTAHGRFRQPFGRGTQGGMIPRTTNERQTMAVGYGWNESRWESSSVSSYRSGEAHPTAHGSAWIPDGTASMPAVNLGQGMYPEILSDRDAHASAPSYKTLPLCVCIVSGTRRLFLIKTPG